MTRRDFELIAECIKEEVDKVHDYTHPDNAEGALNAVARGFAARLRATNPRFDCDRFMTACGFKGK